MAIYSGFTIYPLKMVIFHSYVSLPEGKTEVVWCDEEKLRWPKHGAGSQPKDSHGIFWSAVHEKDVCLFTETQQLNYHFSGKDDDIPVEFCVPHFETETRISLIQHTSTRAGRYATMWSSMPMPGPTRKAGCSDSMRFDESWMQTVFFNGPEFMLTGSKRSYCLNLTSK